MAIGFHLSQPNQINKSSLRLCNRTDVAHSTVVTAKTGHRVIENVIEDNETL